MFPPTDSSATHDVDAQPTPTRQNRSVVSASRNSAEIPSGKSIYDGGIEHDSYSADAMPFSSPSRVTDSLLPAFSTRSFSHLPTPQSPNDVGSYISVSSRTPDSPVPLSSQPNYAALAPAPFAQRFPYHSQNAQPGLSPSRSQQIMTPESSPLVESAARQVATLPQMPVPSPSTSRDKVNGVNLEMSITNLAPAHRISTSSPSPEATRSALSSPFMAKLTLGDRSSKSRPVSPPPQGPSHPAHVDDIFSTAAVASTSNPQPLSGGEMERIRLQVLEDGMAHFQETEGRRPEYLKRTKRSLLDSDPTVDPVLDLEERESVLPGVGITVSPMKGRRLKLFQETSEESFEESLMAGGYERYRNADWLQQSAPGAAGPVSSSAEIEPVLSEKELRKRKRLAAFGETSRGLLPTSKLHPVEVEGKGRLLLDTHLDHFSAPVDPSPSKKKTPRRKKKEAVETLRNAGPGAARGPETEVPNWPDSEFPWSLRVEEQTEKARATQEERLRWIEKFLDRDSDEEEDDEDEEILPSTMWGQVYEDAPMPSRKGRGKMVGLPASQNEGPRRRAFFPSDPADARAALLSKRSVRTLSYRTQQRMMKGRPKTWEEDSDEEEICFCHGRDDGRELVQCDVCEMWYHLQCIGIKSIKELGREEDPWFCANCSAGASAIRTPSPELVPSSEPTFVPTDERQTPNFPYDPLFYQSLPASPATPWSSSRPPRTPTRSGEAPVAFSSGSSNNDPTRIGPSTPHFSSHGVRVYSTPGPFDNFGSDESSFDPTSTPSRGIKFGAPFATPKNNLWSARAHGLFQTPSRPGYEPSGRPQLGAPVTSSSVVESGGTLPFSSPSRANAPYDDTPIRRSMSGEGSKYAPPRRLPESPLAPRLAGGSYMSLQESPVMHTMGRSRGYDLSGRPALHEGHGRSPPGPAEERR